jgi:hypothetical protein
LILGAQILTTPRPPYGPGGGGCILVGRNTLLKKRFLFLMMTIDLMDVFCRQSIIGIDLINVFFTIGAQLCSLLIRSFADMNSNLSKHNLTACPQIL